MLPLMFPRNFLYVRNAPVAHPLVLFQYLYVHRLLVLFGWHKENTVTEGQILALNYGGFLPLYE